MGCDEGTCNNALYYLACVPVHSTNTVYFVYHKLRGQNINLNKTVKNSMLQEYTGPEFFFFFSHDAGILSKLGFITLYIKVP